MYEQFYGLTGKPFHLSPDPKFFFESTGHARALAYLHYGVEQGEGFVVLTGDVGTGKTTLARMLYEELQRSNDMAVAQIALTQCSANDLLFMIADAFGVEHDRRTRASVLNNLTEFLKAQHAAGRRALLLLDEVQNLPLPALETLRMLSNIQTDATSLIQSILLGQAEFRRTLAAPNLKQLRQRVIASCHLLPFARTEETRAYIEHRLRHVGWKDDPSISDEAFESIQSFTQGIPRRINTFCDRLLLFAYLEELHEISYETVSAVADEISSDFSVIPAAGSERPAGEVPAGANPDRLVELEERVRLLEEALGRVRDGLDDSLSGDRAMMWAGEGQDRPRKGRKQG